MYNCIVLLIVLVFIIVSSLLFCNALEHFGEKLGVSEGVTGSIFAAIATALPETIIPILALANYGQSVTNHDIAIGAILGAPLMLSTLSIFIMAMSVIWQRGLNGAIVPENIGFCRDLKFFLFGYVIIIFAICVQRFKFHWLFDCFFALILGLSYFIYILLTVKESGRLVTAGHNTKADKTLFLAHLGCKINWYTIGIQLVFATMMLVYFADMFIDAVGGVALLYNIPPFLLALIIIPIATEFPEKINSIIWIRRGKDTLAIGNLTGAMVFQGTLLPIVGILFTSWKLNSAVYLFSIVITLAATLWLYFNARKGRILVWQFLFNGFLYAINVLICIYFVYS